LRRVRIIPAYVSIRQHTSFTKLVSSLPRQASCAECAPYLSDSPTISMLTKPLCSLNAYAYTISMCVRLSGSTSAALAWCVCWVCSMCETKPLPLTKTLHAPHTRLWSGRWCTRARHVEQVAARPLPLAASCCPSSSAAAAVNLGTAHQ
jgi:hypothetical protein